ncbi:MAG: putative outer rane efflux protein [Labilithrix sp.]|nr:putative outer rane efflux protein [Labilithrix sp.]
MRLFASFWSSCLSGLRAAIRPHAAARCEARSTPIATRRSWSVGWLGALGVLILTALVLLLTRSACADERAPGNGHTYSLGECLALTEHTHPAIAAARARLAAMGAQLEEARSARAPLVALSSRFGVVPNTQTSATGAPVAPTGNFVTQGLASGVGPFLQLGLSATLPLYTFGKISAANRAAEAQVRLGEWDVEKERQQVRIEVRRAFYGVTAARDLLSLVADALAKLDDAIANVRRKLEGGEHGVDEVDRMRLEANRDELVARTGDARRGEASALAALRFYTGVQTGFDVPDEPLVRPSTPLAPIVTYLTAARTHRPDVNRARAGVVARSAQVDWARANLLPDLGLGMQFDWTLAPGVKGPVAGVDTSSVNSPQLGAAFGLQWSLDLFTKNARVHQAESNLDEARALERLALGGSATEVEVAYAAAVEASAREETWDRAVRRAKGWLVAVRDAIDLGTKDESALVEPLRMLVVARANQLQALMDTNMTRAELARLTGWENAAAPS